MSGTVNFGQVYGGQSNVSSALLSDPPESLIAMASSPGDVKIHPAMTWIALIGMLIVARLLYEKAS